ncbi:restriction endonuclease subunit S [Enterococcus lactis]|uniref:restriction endonuclease subunit S n=1 Tax=Enterococcus lactis TaxID=357441 RepID=UPI0040429DB4
MSKDKQPEIRFPGFTEDWEQCLLGETLKDLKSGLSRMLSNDDIGLPVVRANNINDGQFDMINDVKYWYENDPQGAKTENYLVHKNDILINFINSEAKMGTATIVQDEPERKTIYTTNILKAQVADNFDADFWFALTQTYRYKIDIKMITKPAVNQASFTTVDFKKLSYPFPAYDEQVKIGSFFKNLDHLITLHQRKLDLLKETKKGFLQKMFPKNGAKVPEVRFPGFTEDWEERKFGEIVQVSRGLTYKPSDVQIEGIRVLRSSNINEDVFVLRDDDVFVKPDAVNIAPIKNGDILITSANGSSRLVGKHAIVNGLQDKTVHGGFMLRVKSKNTWFTNSLMSSRWYNYFINIYVSGGNGAIGNLRKYDLESQTIIVPDDEEQQKIGAFFKQLDDTIALHQRKLDLLKETKKGFLQKMFV